MGLPTLRLRADYFAIVSLAVTESLRLLFRHLDGTDHRRRPGPAALRRRLLCAEPDPARRLRPRSAALERGPVVPVPGRGLDRGRTRFRIHLDADPLAVGTRHQSDTRKRIAPTSLGKSVFRYKMQSLVLGGLIGSIAGVVLALNQQDVNPETYLSTLTFFAFTALILGGMGRTVGPVVGAFIFWVCWRRPIR